MWYLLGFIGGMIAAVLLAVLAVRLLGGNIMLVDDWKKSYRWYSTWAIALLAFLPDLLNGLMATGLLDGTPIGEKYNLITKLVCSMAFVLRNLKQVKRPSLPDFRHDDEG